MVALFDTTREDPLALCSFQDLFAIENNIGDKAIMALCEADKRDKRDGVPKLRTLFLHGKRVSLAC